MKVGDLVKIRAHDLPMYGILIQQIDTADPFWEGLGEWMVFFDTLEFGHPCWESEIELVSETVD